MHNKHFETGEEALEFLKEFMAEYNTQDNKITVSPYFIVIRDPRADDEGTTEMRQNNMFLTHTAADKHMKDNSYHYSKNAHTYLNHAWRNPELERLLEAIGLVAGIEYERK